MKQVKIVIIWEKIFMSTEGNKITINDKVVFSGTSNIPDTMDKAKEIAYYLKMAGLDSSIVEL